jgi:hypothetical protein
LEENKKNREDNSRDYSVCSVGSVGCVVIGLPVMVRPVVPLGYVGYPTSICAVAKGPHGEESK